MSSRVRNWIGEMMLRAAVHRDDVARVPVLGGLLRRVGRKIMPPDQPVWMQVLHGPGKGLWLELNPRVGSAYREGRVESGVQLALAGYLRAGMTVYDIGANIGFFTLLAARIVGDRGKVYSFEPDSTIAARLKRNVEKNGFANVTVVNAGVWSSTGTVEFIVADSSSPDRGIGRFTFERGQQNTIPAQCISLDDFIKDAAPPDAIKCDVEGAEIEVLRGGSSLLRDYRPWIVSELHSEENRREVRRLLASCGYLLSDVDESHVVAHR